MSDMHTHLIGPRQNKFYDSPNENSSFWCNAFDFRVSFKLAFRVRENNSIACLFLLESRYEEIFQVSQFSIRNTSRILKNLRTLKVDVHTIEISLNN